MVRRVVKVLIAALSLAIVARSAVRAADDATQRGATLPAGVGREVVLRLCDNCHAVKTATALRRLPKEWQGVIDRMYAMGLSATPAEAAQVVAYFNRHYGKVEVNRAPASTLMAVLEINAATAKAVIQTRPHATISDLAKVRGLNDRKIAAIRDRVVF